MPDKFRPSSFEVMGNKPINIEEYFGRVNSGTDKVSIARIKCPGGWVEPGQTPEFDEYTIVLKGVLRISTKESNYDIKAGEAIVTRKGEWIQYNTPTDEGAEYMAVCLPAFSDNLTHRESF